MTNGVINITDNNMSAPLLALSFGVVLFSVISSLAFATVLGTVSGLIVASAGAVAHDLMDNFFGMNMTERARSGPARFRPWLSVRLPSTSALSSKE